jgi:rhamnosyltransferase
LQGLAASTAAVVVVYHLATDIEPALRQLQQSVARLLVVDNHEQGHPALADLTARLRIECLRAGNAGGLAGAYNRALAWLQVHEPQLAQVVFLDEDSDPSSLAALLADGTTTATLARPETAAVSPAYRDRATGLRGRYIRLARFKLDFNPREFSDLRPVAFLINSMTVWRLAALQRIGAFHEGLAIDHVDTEYCLRARQAGLALYVNGAFEFAHAIGQRRKYRLLGVELQASGHSPRRRWMIARNTVWLARNWFWREPAFCGLCLARLVYEAVGITLAEEQAAAKLLALLRGAVSGLFARHPPVRPVPTPAGMTDTPPRP